MRKIVKNNKELNSKQISALLAGAIVLTGVTGCSNKNTETTVLETTSTTTTSIETTVEPTETTVDLNRKDVATVEYMDHAKGVANAMYEANKAYFDDNQFTVEELEDMYYLINGKYYDSKGNLLMDKVELDRAFDGIRNLVDSTAVSEALYDYSDYEHRYINHDEYVDNWNSFVHYDYNYSLSNFIDDNENNKELKKFVNDFSIEMLKITTDLQNVATEGSYTLDKEHTIDFFAKIRSAQSGDMTDYVGIDNYLQENCADDGYAFLVASIYKAIPDYILITNDDIYVNVQDEDVRIGLDYDERILLNAYYEGDLVLFDDIKAAKSLENQLFQTMPNDVACYRQEKIISNHGYNTYNNQGFTKTYTI